MTPERGNPGVQVMDLIAQLEGKVRSKNQIIEELKEESNDWRVKYLLLLIFGRGHPMEVGIIPFVVGVVTGVGVGGMVMFLIMRRFGH